MGTIIGIVIGVIIFFIFLSGFFTVGQQNAAIVEMFGKFSRVAGPGLNLKIPLIENVRGHVSLRVAQLDVQVETKTQDNVFVHIMVSVQYLIKGEPQKIYEAFYKLTNAKEQITSYVFDVVRARVPKIKLDDVFEKKDEIADAVKTELSVTMNEYGFEIIKALVTAIDPEEKVKQAMNEINAAQRLRVAAIEKGEADKILRVKAAEAEAESKKLQGEGIANQRKAIMEGLRESVEMFKSGIPGATAQDVMNLLVLTQYMDTIKAIGEADHATVLMIPHSPASVNDLADQIRNSLVAAGEVAKASGELPKA